MTKYINFTVLTEQEVTRTDKNEKEIAKNISCRLQFLDSARFMASSFLNLANDISEEIHKIKFKYRNNSKDDLIEHECSCSKKTIYKSLMKS